MCFCILKCYFSQSLLQILISQTCLFTSWQLQGCSELSVQTDFPHQKGFLLNISGFYFWKFRTSKTFLNVEIFSFLCSGGLSCSFQITDFLRKERCFRLKNNKEYFVFLRVLQGRNLRGSGGGGGQGAGPGLPTQGRSPSPPGHPPPQGCWVGASPSSSCCRRHTAGGALFERALASPDVLAPSPDMLDLPRKSGSSHIKRGWREKKGIALC